MIRCLSDMGLRYIDLFAGCGGLSLGLEKAGFELVLAVEKSDMAAESFYHNLIKRLASADEWKDFCSLPHAEQAKGGLIVKELAVVLEDEALLAALREAELDLVAGGPPCQGFSMAGRRNPTDQRNRLPWDFLDFVEAVQPKAVLIENVVGINRDFNKHGAKAPFYELATALSQTVPGFFVQPLHLNAAHFGVPEHRPRMILAGVRHDLVSTDAPLGVADLWASQTGQSLFDMSLPILAPRVAREATRTVDDALWDLDDQGYAIPSRTGRYTEPAGAYAAALRFDPSWFPPAAGEIAPLISPPNHTLRRHTPETSLRFSLYQYLSAHRFSSNLLNIPRRDGTSDAAKLGELRAALAPAPLPAKTSDGTVIARSLDDLVALVMSLGTRKHSQRSLRADRPSPTVLSLPDDFVHPVSPRTLSVRELARLQSFPDLFEFRAKETTGSLRRRFEVPQYTQVGNAVPPFMAHALGQALAMVLTST